MSPTLSTTAATKVLIAQRDGGWTCHYCGQALVPVDRVAEVCRWRPRKVYWDHCGCGEHVLSHGSLPMPCVVEGGYTAPGHLRWAETDHKTPRCLGGGDQLENLVLACGPCNSRKGKRPYAEFMALTQESVR